MRTQSNHSRLTRRQFVAFSGAISLTALAPTSSLGQSTPIASPASSAANEAHPDLLVSPEWLADRLDDPNTLAVGLLPAEAFEVGHIPGSLQIDWPELELSETTDDAIAAWRTDIENRIGDLGITPETAVVAWDAGSRFAARLWWVLHWLGHQNIRILNGGLGAWTQDGYAVDTGPVVQTLIEHPPYDGNPNRQALARMPEVLESLNDPTVAIIDARSPDDYAAGHIPGAINVPHGENVTTADPARWLTIEELRDLYRGHGVHLDQRVIPYCNTGVLSAITAFSMHMAGYDVGLFTGSWAEWSSHPDAPVETGD